jgi:histidinol-phosphate aminotransferase
MSDVSFYSLANLHIRNLTPYQPGKPIEEVERELGIPSVIKLASNENPLGASPLALASAQNALLKAQMYPDGGCYDIKQALAKFLKINPTQLTIGNGSENILELIAKSYLTKDTAAVVSQYAFQTIQILITSYAAEMIMVPAREFGHDVKAMLAAINEKTRIIFMVNPNNPTGTFASVEEIKLLLESVPPHVLMVMDEAYHEYIQQADHVDLISLISKYPNLVITRTFSKAYGLAGLRLGYAISSPEIADILNRARLPFNVNSVASAACVAALQDQNHIVKTLAVNTQGMQQLENAFASMKIKYIPSRCNFIAFDIAQNAIEIYQKLLYQGVIVRPLGAYGMPTFLRVTIGTLQENEKFIRALHEVL